MEPTSLSATLAAVALSATLTAPPAPSATPAAGSDPAWYRKLGAKISSNIQVHRVDLKGSREAALTLPDGNGRVVVGTAIGPSTMRMGANYNFVNGKIQAWIGYGFPIWRNGPSLQLAGSDDIGLGRIYLKTRYLERARSVPLGLGWHLFGTSMLAVVERTSWRLAPYADPAAQDFGLIDAVGATLTTSQLIPDVVQALRQEQTRQDETVVRYRRAFRGLGGNWHFDRADADLRFWLKGLRRDDELMVRTFWGQAWNMSPALPLRETYALGGANALRGYEYEGFRGTGMAVVSLEHAWRTPWRITVNPLGMDLHRSDLIVFADAGRIHSGWTHGDGPFKWSFGGGVRFGGRMIGTHKSVFRLLVAQAVSRNRIAPVYYALADVL